MNLNNNYSNVISRKVAVLVSGFLFTIVILQLITIFKIDYLDVSENDNNVPTSIANEKLHGINGETINDLPRLVERGDEYFQLQLPDVYNISKISYGRDDGYSLSKRNVYKERAAYVCMR